MAFSDKPRTPGKARPKASLKMQAIGFLSRREHSRTELRAKLLSALHRAEREEAAATAAAEAHARNVAEALRAVPSNGIDDAFAPRVEPTRGDARDPAPAQLEAPDPEAVVEQLLDWLTANGYLSDARFVESRVNARARKQGATLIRHELSRHGLELAPEQAATLRETEFARAQAIWQRKFGDVAGEPRERARQARFLAARGFASDVVRRIVGGEEEF